MNDINLFQYCFLYNIWIAFNIRTDHKRFWMSYDSLDIKITFKDQLTETRSNARPVKSVAESTLTRGMFRQACPLRCLYITYSLNSFNILFYERNVRNNIHIVKISVERKYVLVRNTLKINVLLYPVLFLVHDSNDG